LCMITKFMNKWTFTFYKYSCLPLHYVYLMQGFHHILLDICKYLMMQSPIWQMVRTRTFKELSLDSPEDLLDVGVVKSHVAVPHFHHLNHLSA
jgi:hypothetical protein